MTSNTDRVTWGISTEAAEALEAAANRKDSESATVFVLRVAELLDGTENGTDVTNRDIPENVLTEAHLDDIAHETARRTAQEVENRLR